MKKMIWKLKLGRMLRWINPVLMLICLYFLLGFLFSSEPLFIKTTSPAVQGEVPIVSFHLSRTMFGTLFVFILFNIFLFATLRQWARYYLNRKLVLSYLFFAIIPLMTSLSIFFAGITTWLGISNSFTIEKTMELHTRELVRFVESIQQDLKDIESFNIDPEAYRKVVNTNKANVLNSLRYLQASSIPVRIYFQTFKSPGASISLVPVHLPEEESKKILSLFSENTPGYEQIYPGWMTGDSWTDIVHENNELYIRHFNVAKQQFGRILVVASIPIDRQFLHSLKEFQSVTLTLRDKDGTRFIASDPPSGKWYLRLLLRPFSSKRDVLALNWDSGHYEQYGSMAISFEPAEIGRLLEKSGSLNFFYGGEQEYSLRLIIGSTILLILWILLAIGFGIYLIRYITSSLNKIAEGHERIKAGRLDYRLPLIGRDQLGSMGRSFNSMVNSIQTLMTEVSQKEKYEEELRIARKIQMSLLPDLDALPWCNNIAASCIPAREVGGDYYEVLRTKTGEIGVFIADVSGKGTSAAFYMAELKGILIALKHLWNRPVELMLRLNEILHTALAANVFVSAAYLLLDPDTGMGQMARAGHCPAYHVRGNGRVDELLPPGIALGIARNDIFAGIIRPVEFYMEPDDKIVLYTDGLDEMMYHHKMYGTGKLKEVLRRQGALGVTGLRDAIIQDVLDFLSSETQSDDLTLVVAGLPKRDPRVHKPQSPVTVDSSV